MFDRDDNSNEVLRRAYEIAKKEGYHIIYSNPCFEFWYLLHFTNYTGYLENCEAVIVQLDKPGRLEKYKKSKEVFEVLKGLQEEAIENASRQIEKLEKEHKKFLTREANPTTNVFELVTYLNQQIKL